MTSTELERLAQRVAEIVATKLVTAPMLINKQQLSDRTTLSLSTIERLVKSGKIPAIKTDRRVMFAPDAVLAALSRNEETQASD